MIRRRIKKGVLAGVVTGAVAWLLIGAVTAEGETLGLGAINSVQHGHKGFPQGFGGRLRE